MTFVGLDGKKHTAHLDSGPFEKGDEFMMKGRVYRYNGYETDKTNNLKVELRDITSFNKETFTLKIGRASCRERV